ncbi:MAG: hydrogenase formation protein HypD [Euryarchaeota archaeon]|nr:hydrogenase formation protein HypD [Euryarchaeota archaeon]
MFRFRDDLTARKILERISGLDLKVRFMHVCGTHQDTLVRFGLEGLLRGAGIEIRQGPGCPVCVTTSSEISETIAIAESGVTVAVFGDMLTVPTPAGSLAEAKAKGADVKVVYSVDDAVRMSKEREVVFMGVGFETTSPTVASAIEGDPPGTFSVLSCHRLVPPALDAIFQMGEVKVDGLIQPGHVSAIIGLSPYRHLSKRWGVPQVIAGFEPLDLLMAVYMLSVQVSEGRAEVENEYARVVRPEGNERARSLLSKVFTKTDKPWRGFPMIRESALELRPAYELHDARVKYRDLLAGLPEFEDELAGCRCGEVLRGLISSEECPLFAVACAPQNPMGPCMVSREGSCNIIYRYRGGRGLDGV